MSRVCGGRQRGEAVEIKRVSCSECGDLVTRRQSVVFGVDLFCPKCGVAAEEKQAQKLVTFRKRCQRRDWLFLRGAKNEFDVSSVVCPV